MSPKVSLRDLPGSERYSKLSMPALKELLKERQLRITGSKSELIARVLQQDKERQEDAVPAAAPGPAPAAAAVLSPKPVSRGHRLGRTHQKNALANLPVKAALASVPARDGSPVRKSERKAKTTAHAGPPAPTMHPTPAVPASGAPRAQAASSSSSHTEPQGQAQEHSRINLQGARIEDALVEIGNADGGMEAAQRRGRQPKRAAGDPEAAKSAPRASKRRATPMTRAMPRDLFAKNSADLEAHIERRPKKSDLDIVALCAERAGRHVVKENDEFVMTNDVHYVVADSIKFLYRKVMDRAESLARFIGHSKITQRDIQAALQICMGGDVVDGMHAQGVERVQEYRDYQRAQQH